MECFCCPTSWQVSWVPRCLSHPSRCRRAELCGVGAPSASHDFYLHNRLSSFLGGSWSSLILNSVYSSNLLASVLQQQSSARLWFFFFFFFFWSFWGCTRIGGSQARSPIGAVAAGLHHSHNNAGSKPNLQPTLQFMATP